VVIFPALGIWEPAAAALPGFDVAPATPVAIANTAATAASVASLVHLNMSPPLFTPCRSHVMPQPQSRSIQVTAPVLRRSRHFSRANTAQSRRNRRLCGFFNVEFSR
jgi:hypothetical protein